MVFVLALLPIELAQLGCAFDSSSGCLLDIDVDHALVVGVLLAVESDGCETDGFACEPANALEYEDGVGVVGKGLVLFHILAECSTVTD